MSGSDEDTRGRRLDADEPLAGASCEMNTVRQQLIGRCVPHDCWWSLYVLDQTLGMLWYLSFTYGFG